ncbi:MULTISPECIES: DoxX family protein [unclassified Geodermatophilus]
MRPPAPATWLAAALGGSGVLHLVRPRTYEWLVPPELGDARGWVLGSGVAEVATAALLSASPSRRAGGWAAAVLLASFLPAHLHHLRVARGRPALLAAGVVRLPLQVPMIAAALRVARGRA